MITDRGVAAEREYRKLGEGRAIDQQPVLTGIELVDTIDAVSGIEDENVCTCVACEYVITAMSDNRVVACATANHVYGVVAFEPVVEFRSAEPLDVFEHIPAGRSGSSGTVAETDGNPRLSVGVVCPVVACASAHPVCARTAVEEVVTVSAEQEVVTARSQKHVAAGIAGNVIVERGAADMFDGHECVAKRRAGGTPGGEIQRDRGSTVVVLCPVLARSAIKMIGSGTPTDHVAPVAAEDLVIAAVAQKEVVAAAAVDVVIAPVAEQAVRRRVVAGERIAVSRPVDMLDVFQNIACRVSASGLPGRNADRDA